MDLGYDQKHQQGLIYSDIFLSIVEHDWSDAKDLNDIELFDIKKIGTAKNESESYIPIIIEGHRYLLAHKNEVNPLVGYQEEFYLLNKDELVTLEVGISNNKLNTKHYAGTSIYKKTLNSPVNTEHNHNNLKVGVKLYNKLANFLQFTANQIGDIEHNLKRDEDVYIRTERIKELEKTKWLEIFSPFINRNGYKPVEWEDDHWVKTYKQQPINQ